jgi:hypothetical protein
MIPVISADHAMMHKQDSAGQWRPEKQLALHLRRSRLIAERGGWMMASNHSRSMRIQQVFLAGPEDVLPAKKEDENDAIKKIIRDMEKESAWHEHDADRVDLDGDRQEDLVLWWAGGELDPKTDIRLFLRGADNQLPEQPTQILRCRGLPIRVGPRQLVSPMCDLNGDGVCELVLVALKTTITSWSSLVDMAISRGVDWVFTIRFFNGRAYSKSPNAHIDMTTMLPAEIGVPELFLVDGDFNGDGRRDVLVKRSVNQWDVFLSSAGAGWFAAKPALTLETPMEGYFDIQDLNGDGLSDMAFYNRDEAHIQIFLSSPRQNKGTIQ